MDFEIDRPDLFPPETVVSLFHAEDVVDFESGAPLLVSEGDIESVGLQRLIVGEIENEEEETEIDPAITAIEFTEVETRRYVAAAMIDDQFRAVQFTPGDPGGNLLPPTAFPNHDVN